MVSLTAAGRTTATLTMAPLTLSTFTVAYGAPVMKEPNATCPSFEQWRSQKSSKLLTWFRVRVRVKVGIRVRARARARARVGVGVGVGVRVRVEALGPR